MSTKENQYITDVIIRGSKYQLWELNDREPHSLGTMNGESGTLWVKDIDATFKEIDDEWIPWLDMSSNRDCWGIFIKDGNSIKYKWDSYKIDKHTSVDIQLNNKTVYEINGRDFDWCYNESRSKIYKLKELIYTFNVNLKNPEKEIGRKIFYKGMPAIIDRIFTSGTMSIKADYSNIEKEFWWDQMINPWDDEDTIEDLKENKSNNGTVIDILNNNIHWSRNDRSVKLNKIKRNVNEKGTS